MCRRAQLWPSYRRLISPRLSGAYRKAVLTATNLQRIADQDEQLFKTDALSQRDLEQAQADAASAIADREAAKEQIKSLGIDPSVIEECDDGSSAANVPSVIRAPISGTVVERLITPGQLLQAGTTPAFTIADLSTVWVMANVFESGSSRGCTRVNESLSRVDVSPTPFDGTVDYVGALVDPLPGRLRFVWWSAIEAICSSETCTSTSQSGSDRQKSGILVPADAVLRDDQNLPYVYVATGAVTEMCNMLDAA